MKSPLPKAANGFTIVELMFVLAIAGFITLLIFEAIPALQHSSQNNLRKQDVAIILQAVSHYELNNSGTVPACSGNCADPGGPLEFSQNKLRFYEPSDITMTAGGSGGPTVTPPNTPDTVEVYNYYKCDADSADAVSSGAGYNDLIALYSVASGSRLNGQCQSL